LIVSLRCSHARFVPNVREVRELHMTSELPVTQTRLPDSAKI
jgi:hypothetical protein